MYEPRSIPYYWIYKFFFLCSFLFSHSYRSFHRVRSTNFAIIYYKLMLVFYNIFFSRCCCSFHIFGGTHTGHRRCLNGSPAIMRLFWPTESTTKNGEKKHAVPLCALFSHAQHHRLLPPPLQRIPFSHCKCIECLLLFVSSTLFGGFFIYIFL